MANLVNMQQTEYDETYGKLCRLHEKELAAVREIEQLIKTLAQIDGGFYVEKISAKIDALLGCLDGSVLAALESAFELTENTMETYMSAVVNIDTI